MRNFINILLSEIKPNPKRASIAVVINILSTLLLYLVFMVGFGHLLPRILFIDINAWMFPGIVGFVSTIIAFNLSLQDSFHSSREVGLIDQIHSSPLLTYQIYLVKSLVYLLKSSGHLILSSIVLLIASGVHVGFVNLLAFCLYFFVGLIFVNQFGLIAGIIATNLKVRSEFTIIFVAVIFLACGVIVPSTQYPGILGQIIHYFPVTILIEGGRDILVFNTLSNINMIYVLSFSILAYFAAFLTFKRWISR
ncbi:ABC transporter permease [bacterium]|nr:ABC transporter permease [bacterium]MBU1065147.1 ABC transporter permease [bacterium]MBU1633142.1 ABC transporter permease [bacterium]MBU1872322.1 ABC transporter permease [bacterium]